MNKILIIPLCCSLCFNLSCIEVRDKSKSETSQEVAVDSLYTIDLQQTTRSEQSPSINDFAQDIRFINLEFQKESALSTINFRADKIDDKLIVSSLNSPVMQFDTLGRYEKSLITFGRDRAELRRSIYKSTLNNGELTYNQGYKTIALTTNSKMGYISQRYYFGVVSLSGGGYVALPNMGLKLLDDDTHLDFLDSDFNCLKSVKHTGSEDLYYDVPQGYSGRLESCTLSPSKSGGALFRMILVILCF